MRVLLVSPPYLPIPPKKYGGTEQVIYHLIKGLKELGHEPVLIAPGDSEVDCEVVPCCPKALDIPSRPEDVEPHRIKLQEAQAKTKELIHQLLPTVDILHAQNMFDLSEFQDFPTLKTIHDGFTFDSIAIYNQDKHQPYVAISHNQQKACPNLNYAGVVYNGEDPKDFPIVKESEDYLCFLGRFHPDKNPHLAIELAINLGMKLKMAGALHQPGAAYFKQYIEPYLDHPLIEYLGELGFEDKIRLVSNAKCNLHPTGFREPFGLTVIEAAFCGTPTLAIKRGAMAELIEHGRTGMLVEDFVEGFHMMEEIYRMDRRYIANRARLLFNHINMARSYVQVYEKVIEGHKNKQKQKLQLQQTLVIEESSINTLELEAI
jgi:glycosyltransferase involved in cell wall biosynthesis